MKIGVKKIVNFENVFVTFVKEKFVLIPGVVKKIF